MKAYLVMGSSGDYGEGYDWPVMLFFEEWRAIEHANQARQRARELTAPIELQRWWQIPRGANQFDPQMMVYGSGIVEYGILAVLIAPGTSIAINT